MDVNFPHNCIFSIAFDPMKTKLKYLNKGRGGTVVYRDEKGELNFFFEYGGGNCIAIIYVPAIDEWIKTSGRPVEDRQAVLSFIAEQIIKDKAPGCNYMLSTNCIEIFIPEDL